MAENFINIGKKQNKTDPELTDQEAELTLNRIHQKTH